MNFQKTLAAGLMVYSACMGQSIQISGIVEDTTTGTGIPNAIVRLVQNGAIDTTDNTGAFSLVAQISGAADLRTGALAPVSPEISSQGAICFTLARQERVSIQTYSAEGRQIGVIDRTYQAGSHSVTLSPAPNCICLHRICIGGKIFVLVSLRGGNVSRPDQAAQQGSERQSLAKHAATLAVIKDTITVSLANYITKRIPVTQSVISGLQISLAKPPANSVADIDGNVYSTVVIGTQTWIVGDLKTTHYNDGTTIPNVTANTAWAALASAGYCWFNNDMTTKNPWGAMYNYYAVSTGKLAPTGWHVATVADLNTLVAFLGGTAVAGAAMREVGTAHWAQNTVGTNSSGLTLIACGRRQDNGTFDERPIAGGYLLYTAPGASSCNWFYLDGNNASVSGPGTISLIQGEAVLCVKD